MAGRFTAVVLVATAVTFLVKWQASSPHALDDAIALLIVTCPCALALATPLAITVAVGRASRRGMLIKGDDALREVATSSVTVVLGSWYSTTFPRTTAAERAA